MPHNSTDSRVVSVLTGRPVGYGAEDIPPELHVVRIELASCLPETAEISVIGLVNSLERGGGGPNRGELDPALRPFTPVLAKILADSYHRCIQGAAEEISRKGSKYPIAVAEVRGSLRRTMRSFRRSPEPKRPRSLAFPYFEAALEILRRLSDGVDTPPSLPPGERKTVRLSEMEIRDFKYGKGNDRLLRMFCDFLVERVVAIRRAHRIRNGARIKPREWARHIIDADRSSVGSLEQFYARSTVPSELLLLAVHPDAAIRSAARERLGSRAGFLHEDPPDYGQVLPPHGVAKLLQHPTAGLRGYYSCVTDPTHVREILLRDLGWDPGPGSPSGSLPERSDTGRLTWTNPAYARVLLRDMGRLVLPGELVVQEDESGLPLRNMGIGKALKVAVYRELPPGCVTLTRIFELVRINGTDLIPPVKNRWSWQLNTSLGSTDIGVLTEEFRRDDGLELCVNWRLCASHVSEVLGHADDD